MAATAEPNFNLGPFGEIKLKNLEKFSETSNFIKHSLHNHSKFNSKFQCIALGILRNFTKEHMGILK